MTDSSSPEAIERRRRDTLGWLLGYNFGLLNHIVVSRVRERGHPRFQLSHSTLTRAMSFEGDRLTNLAVRASVTKQAMSQLVQQMSELGYVSTRRDPADGRAKLVVYRKKGRELAQTIVEVAREVETACTARLGARRMGEVRAGLGVVTEVLEAMLPESDAGGR